MMGESGRKCPLLALGLTISATAICPLLQAVSHMATTAKRHTQTQQHHDISPAMMRSCSLPTVCSKERISATLLSQACEIVTIASWCPTQRTSVAIQRSRKESAARTKRTASGSVSDRLDTKLLGTHPQSFESEVAARDIDEVRVSCKAVPGYVRSGGHQACPAEITPSNRCRSDQRPR